MISVKTLFGLTALCATLSACGPASVAVGAVSTTVGAATSVVGGAADVVF